MIKFLSEKNFNLLADMIPQIAPFSQHRFVSYLSFYLSYSSKHLYYSPDLLSSQALGEYFHPSYTGLRMEYDLENVNKEQLIARQLLGINFQEHVIDEQGVLRWYSDLYRLLSIGKKDIIEEFFKSKCRVDSSDRIKIVEDIIPVFRRTFYIACKGSLPDSTTLQQKITMNPFYQLKNTNKVLLFAETAQTNLQLPQQLQKFCKQFDIKIKLLKNNNLKGILQYLYTKSRKNILIHEHPNADNSIYEFQAQKNQKKDKPKSNDAIKSEESKLNSRLKPQAIMILSQRLPKQTLVKENKAIILQKMKRLLNTPSGQNLLHPNTLNFQQLQKNYIYQTDDDQNDTFEGRHGFSVRQYVTEKVYQQSRAPEINRGNPFSEKKAKFT